jgi:hypothetical protein
MSCNSQQNTISHLKELGVLDESGLITDTSRLDKINNHYLDYINNQLGIESNELLLPYREVKYTNPAGHSTFKYVLEPNVKLFGKIDNLINDTEVAELDVFDMPATGFAVAPKFEKVIQYKESLANAIEARLAKVKADKRKFSNNTVKLKELTALQNTLETRLEGSTELGISGLREEILDLKAAPAIDKLAFYADADFARLDSLLDSRNPEDIKEAYQIINTYEALGTFDPSNIHPLFHETQTSTVNGRPVVHYVNTGFDDVTGEVIVSQDVQDLLTSWKERVQIPRNKLYLQSKQLFTGGINSNRKVQKMFNEPLTYEELTHKGTGLKDASWVDMFMMDITNGVFSTNGIVPQVMMNMLQNSFQTHLVFAKDVEEKIDGMKDRLDAAMKGLKASHGLDYDLAGKAGWLGIKGISYDLFKAEDKNGLFKDAIVQRYDSSYAEERNKMFNTFKQDLDNAYQTPDPVRRDQLVAAAHNKKRNWFKKHTVVLDIRKMPEITAPGYNYTQAEQDAYRQELVDILGEQGYKEELAKQEKLIKDYESMLDIVTDSIAAEGGTAAEQAAKVAKWTERNNPFALVNDYYENASTGMGKNPSMTYNYAVPRRKRVNMTMVNGVLTPVQTTFDTGYYDKKFEIIEENDTLKEFHDLLMGVQQKMFDVMPLDVRRKFNANSLPSLAKNLIEILTSPHTTFFEKISEAARYMYDKIRGLFGINVQNSLSHAKVDPITGRAEYEINTDFLNSNKEEINSRYQVEILRLKQALGISLTQPFTQYNVYNLNTMNQDALNIIAENLGTEANVAAIMAKLPGENALAFEVGKVIRSGITNQIVQEKSFDLPKILKLYSYMTMEYAARQEVLPIMEMMKGHYEEIKEPTVTNTGATVTNASTKETALEGVRVNANKQMESWFNRAVLGNYGSKNEFGDTTLKRHLPLGLTNNQRINSFTSALSTTITGRILNTDEKIMQGKIPELLSALEYEMASPGITAENMAKAQKLHNRLTNQEAQLGKTFAFTAFFDAMFNFIRLKGLGWNLSSYVTNFAEGQIANLIVDASGDYFKPGNINRANNIVKGSWLKNMTGGKVETKGAKLTRVLMDRYRILQDASNELQKASNKSAFSQVNKLNPFYGTHRTEYMNQAPLMLAVLMDQEITDKDGNVSNVLDAMNPDGTLKPEFHLHADPAQDSNRLNWENANGDAYNDFSSHMIKTIVNTHGDYDQLRGNMASERLTGKALLMFKRWMGRQFYQRFAMVPQTDLEVGVKEYKGRYLSHTRGSGLLHGAIVGFAGAGPVGALALGTAGFAMGHFMGENTGFNFLKEMAFVTKNLFLSLAGIPVNWIAGKTVLKPFSGGTTALTERGQRNFHANMIDMSMQLFWIGFLLATKAMLWDDDDDSDDDRRKAHNILANRFIQLSSQASMYANPVEAYEAFSDIPVKRFFTDVIKVATEAQDYFEGEDTLAGGPNAGQSALGNQIKKTFFPGIAKGGLGFESAMQRQFEPHAFDTWFHGEEKKAKKVTQGIRAQYLLEMVENGLTKEEAKKAVKKKYRNKKSGDKETYKELIEVYESID